MTQKKERGMAMVHGLKERKEKKKKKNEEVLK